MLKNTREFIVKVEKEIKVTLDMDLYTKENLAQINEFWGYDKNEMEEEEIIEEAVNDIAHQFEKDGYLDKDLEGFPSNGQTCKNTNYSMSIKEIKTENKKGENPL
jgi:hypothetical protein